VAPTAGVYYSLGCYGEKSNDRALSEVFIDNSMTVEMCAKEATRRQFGFMGVEYGNECWMGDTLDQDSQPLMQDKCDKICPGETSNWCGGGLSLQMYRLNATWATPKNPAPTGPLSCPEADDTVWTTAGGKSRFRIECGWDRWGGSQGFVSAASFEDCLNACSTTSDCKSVALSGPNCYLKTGKLGTAYRKDDILGATLLTK
jgi:hypothetical protein